MEDGIEEEGKDPHKETPSDRQTVTERGREREREREKRRESKERRREGKEKVNCSSENIPHTHYHTITQSHILSDC